MEKLPKPVSIVMIAYNEERNIEGFLRKYNEEVFRKLAQGSELVVYLDKPTDNTPEIVKNLAREIPLRVIGGEVNLGYAGAMKRALKSARNNVIFYSDSSGKHDPADFWKLMEHEGDHDIVTGLRTNRKDPLIRRVVTMGQRLLISALFLVPLYDFNTGFKIVHKNIVDNVIGDCRYMKQSFSSELLIRAYKKGYSIINVPVSFGGRSDKRGGTTSRHLPGIIYRSFRGFLLLRWELWFGKNHG